MWILVGTYSQNTNFCILSGEWCRKLRKPLKLRYYEIFLSKLTWQCPTIRYQLRSSSDSEFNIVFGGFDLYKNDTNIFELGIAPNLGEEVPLGLKKRDQKSSARLFHDFISAHNKHSKFQNSLVLNCCLVLLWKLPLYL